MPDSNNLNRLIATIPKVFNPEVNRVMYAILYAIALSDDDVEASIQEARKNLFVRTAEGDGLERIARSLGVEKPQTLGLSDEDFQQLIPNLTLKPKAIRKAFYDTADVFWGPLFSRANVRSNNFAPFDLTNGDVFSIKIDGRISRTVKILPGDIQALGVATASEVVAILNKFIDVTASVQADPITGNEYVNIRTNTPGSVGSIEILPSTGFSNSKLDFSVGKYDILKLDQRTCVYNINPNELIIEIPAVIPALRRTLKGSHHFHSDATLESEVAPANGIWQGSFVFNPTGSVSTNTVSGQKCDLQTSIVKNQVYTSIQTTDNSGFENRSQGELIFDYGRTTEEGPVKYRGIPNTSLLLLDPSYIFKHSHDVGSSINVLTATRPYVPAKNGKDLAVYLPSPSASREIVQKILTGLAAAGIIIKFVVLAPKYKYIIDDPYITSDDAPSGS